jgi:hypothetical protein
VLVGPATQAVTHRSIDYQDLGGTWTCSGTATSAILSTGSTTTTGTHSVSVDLYQNCGAEGSVFTVIAAQPADLTYLLYAEVVW